MRVFGEEPHVDGDGGGFLNRHGTVVWSALSVCTHSRPVRVEFVLGWQGVDPPYSSYATPDAPPPEEGNVSSMSSLGCTGGGVVLGAGPEAAA